MRRWLTGALQVVGLSLLLLAAVALTLFIVKALPWSTTWNLWTVLTAVGTVGATLVALVLALRASLQEKDAIARFVSAWVTDEYQPRDDGSSYRRVAHLHIANESNEPVFNAMVNVHIGRDRTPLGPLAAPAPISVIPPRRELIFDVSVPLLAHADSWYPRATLTFIDPKKRHWLRELDGELRDVGRRKLRWSKNPGPGDERQLGNQESLFNPMLIALTFLDGLGDEKTRIEDLFALLAPEASGWAHVDWDKLRSELADFRPTSMVDYPAQRIARVKLSGDQSLEGKSVEGNGKSLELDVYMFITLTLDPRRGWRIFGIGESVPPDAISFGGSLAEEVEPHQDGSAAEEESES